jgi:hypothetical protein
MSTQSNSGTLFALSAAAPATYNAAGFAALTFANIGEVKTGGDFGKTFQVITSQVLSRRGTTKKKGTFDAGSLNLSMELDPDDAGQVLAETAVDSDDDYSVKITLQDGTIYYLRGLVTEFVTTVGGPNDMLMGRIKVDLQAFNNATGDEVAAIKAA